MAEIIDVWQATTHDTDGTLRRTGEFYTTYDEAKKASNGYHPLEPVKRQALQVDQTHIRLLEDGTESLYANKDDRDLRIALSKLTPRERDLVSRKAP